MTNISYDLLYETSEQLYKDDTSDVGSIIMELMAKLTFYRTLDAADLNPEDKLKGKQQLMGNILMTLSHLTLRDNINIYAVHQEALRTFRLNKMEKLALSAPNGISKR